MQINPSELIHRGNIAYHVTNDIIDDMMILDFLGGYKDKNIQELIDDGWSFVCDKRDYQLGQIYKQGENNGS